MLNERGCTLHCSRELRDSLVTSKISINIFSPASLGPSIAKSRTMNLGGAYGNKKVTTVMGDNHPASCTCLLQQLRSFLESLHHFMYMHTQWPLTLPLMSLALFLLFAKFCLTILVTWAALSIWKGHFKRWCIDGYELTKGLAHRAQRFPLPFKAALSALRHYI